jgi:hypothetical protein
MALNIIAIGVKVTVKRAAAYMSTLPYFNPLTYAATANSIISVRFLRSCVAPGSPLNYGD